MKVTWYTRTQPLEHTQPRHQAGHMLIPSLSPEYEVAGINTKIADFSEDSCTYKLQNKKTQKSEQSGMEPVHQDVSSKCLHKTMSHQTRTDKLLVYIPPTGITVCSASMVFAVISGWPCAVEVLQSPPSSVN